MPLGVGIGPATGRHAVCLVVGGGSPFSIHALWTAARYALPSIFVCFVNGEHRLLKGLWCEAMGTTIETAQFIGMEFNNPNLDMQRIAEGSGASSEKIESLQTVEAALGRALAHPGPSFLIIDRSRDHPTTRKRRRELTMRNEPQTARASSLERRLVEVTWTDPAVAKLLREDPRQALAGIGIHVSPNVKLDVRQQRGDTLYFVIPPLAESSKNADTVIIHDLVVAHGKVAHGGPSRCPVSY